MPKSVKDHEIIEALRLLHGHEDFPSLRQALMQMARLLFQSDVVSYSQYDSTLEQELTIADVEEFDRAAQQLSDVFVEVIETHPLFPTTFLQQFDPPTIRISDVMSDVRFRETAVYRDYMRPLGISRQLVIPLWMTPTFHTGVTLVNKRTDFTRRDCKLAALVRPHMIEAFRTTLVQQRLRTLLEKNVSLLENSAVGRIDANFDGQIVSMTGPAQRALQRTFLRRELGLSLPPDLRRWMHEQLVRKVNPSAGRELPPFRKANSSGELVVTMLLVQYELQWVSLLVQHLEHFDPIQRLHRNGLTKREAEVLFRLTFGETDKQIARSLGMRPATARTHVERIRGKLHVETRTAAAAIAQRWLREPAD